MEQAITTDALRLIARRPPRAAFDYADGAAEEEISLGRARSVFREVEVLPTILKDVSKIDLSTSIAGGINALPFGIAPTGFTRMMHSEGKLACAASAAEYGIPFSLTTLATTSIEDIAAAQPGSRRWFQLYIGENRDLTRRLVERARDNGNDTLLVTMDRLVASIRRSTVSFPSLGERLDTIRIPDIRHVYPRKDLERRREASGHWIHPEHLAARNRSNQR